MKMSDKERLRELAQFLKTRRARLSPEQAGLPAGGRRRTPGLRRGEVAQLAGVSVDWYTWMEQARDIGISAQVLDSLSRALRLDEPERRHLYLLALGQLPGRRETGIPGVDPALQRFLDLQGASPAYVTDQRLNVVAWNRAASLLYGPYEELSDRERNSLWRTFTSPAVKALLRGKWEAHARHRLAVFRAGYANYPGDPWWVALIEELTRISPEFAAWWPRHDVLAGPEGKKINHHAAAGRLAFVQISFLVSDAAHLTATVNLPDDEETADRMRGLLEADGEAR
ncbi:helix-turn-helix domain-containing protein [Paenibacillus sp. MWE-103]|uniref:Helix-turn-helix domain-containing protein n=1 Tax=Paenibacillus artemisiicola TaxID=1172618 RepID=A0ABS3WCY7_9BACL|nr:helix-turn-helix transcriptional regulator [Paenibacillus artemisiicola]MBO7746163.1 helix-turn-helix domain-containing protein [Paenibacillus artemisiicola]